MGKYITMAPPVTIWWRCLVGLFFLWLYCTWTDISLKVNLKQDGKQYLISSTLLILHWVTYFYSLHLSSVAIAFITLYTYPAMTTILEPIFLKLKFEKLHLVLGAIVIVGIAIMSPTIDLSDGNFKGVVFGLFSAFCFAMRNIYSRDLALGHNGSHLILIQLIIGAILLLPVIFIFENNNVFLQWEAVVFLGIITTAAGHTLFVRSFKHFSITTASLLGSIIPIYGILLAYFFLGEVPETTTIIGGTIILSTVIFESLRVSRTN